MNTSDRFDDGGMIGSESRFMTYTKEKDEKAKVNKEANAEASKEDSTATAAPKKKNRSKNKVKRLQDTPGHSTESKKKSKVSKKGKSKKGLQNILINSKSGRNKVFQSLRDAGESIKETMKGQMDKVKNLLKPKSKKGAACQSFSEVISKEGVQVGLTLDPYLLDLTEVERVQKEEEENWEEDLMLWEEGWGRDFKLKQVTGEEEEEDIRSPHWEDVKEVGIVNYD